MAGHVKIHEQNGFNKLSPKSKQVQQMYRSATGNECSPKRHPSIEAKASN